MFQHTERHIKRYPTCYPETERVMPLLFELSAINGGVSTEKEILSKRARNAKNTFSGVSSAKNSHKLHKNTHLTL